MRILIHYSCMTVFAAVFCLVLSCQERFPLPSDVEKEKIFNLIDEASDIKIVPMPAHGTTDPSGTLTLKDTITFSSDAASDSTVMWLIRLFCQAGITATKTTGPGATISVTMTAPDSLGSEGYYLLISATGISLSASSLTGQFYAVQTLRQLLPAGVENKSVTLPVKLPLVKIVDKPRFAWRSFMIDVARHFRPVSYLYETVDRMALFKMNVLHLHLTDDQGWRMEIKNPRWDSLHIKASRNCVGGDKPPAGVRWYYTQDELKTLVRYAADRKITIVPEIDMPGHVQAAVSVYPELNTPGLARVIQTSMNVGLSLLNLGKIDTSMVLRTVVDTFINDMLKEEAAIFPGRYIHIGGDECYKASTDQYIKFVRKTEKLVRNLGRSAVGWEEMAFPEDAPPKQLPSTITQSWMGMGPGDILSWAKQAYLDQANRKGDESTNSWAAPEVTLQTTYTTPITDNFKGIEATLFSEYVTKDEYWDRQIWPRLAAIAEVGWAPINHQLLWDRFCARLAPLGKRFDAMGMTWYALDPAVAWERGSVNTTATSAFSGFVPSSIRF